MNCAMCNTDFYGYDMRVFATWSRDGIVVCTACHHELEMLRAKLLGLTTGKPQ